MVIACSLQEIKLFINASLPAPVLHILLQMRLSNALAVIVYSHIREKWVNGYMESLTVMSFQFFPNPAL